MSSTLEQSSVVTEDSPMDWKVQLAAALKKDEASYDLEIVCGDLSCKVHHVIAALHSKFFRDTTEHKVVIEDASPVAVMLMVTYFYSAEYPDPMLLVTDSGADNPRNSLEGHSQVFTLAHKYDIPDLIELAYSKVDDMWWSIYTARKVTDGEGLKELAAYLLVATPHVFNNTPPNDTRLRRDVVVLWMTGEGHQVLEHVNKTDLMALFVECPEFAAEYLEMSLDLHIGCHAGESRVMKENAEATPSKEVDSRGEKVSPAPSKVAEASSKTGGWFGWFAPS